MSPIEEPDDEIDHDEDELDPDEDTYILEDRDWEIINAAKQLLWKMARCSFIRPKQLEAVAVVLNVLECLPKVSEPVTVSADMVGPRRWFGEHEIYHYWTVRIEDSLIEINAGGHFYRQSTGGDSFTSLQWSASPGSESDYGDYLHTLQIVDDAMPFPQEIERINLVDPGYKISVELDGEMYEAEDGKD